MSKIEFLKNEYKNARETNSDYKIVHKELTIELFNLETIWVALSSEHYSVDSHLSIPLICTKDFDGTPAIYVFSKEEYAIEWAKHYNYFSPDSEYYLVGQVNKFPCDFCSLFQIAAVYGAKMVLLDEGDIPVPIGLGDIYYYNNIDQSKIDMPISRAEAEAAFNESGSQFTVKFTPLMAVKVNENSKDKTYEISRERGMEIKNHIFDARSGAELYHMLMEKETLNENCYLFTEIMTGMYPLARQKNDEDMMRFFDMIKDVLVKCIWKRLFTDGNVFILTDEDNNPIKENFVYVAYTDYYMYSGKYKYHAINSEEEIFKAMEANKATGVVITDGPHYYVIVGPENFSQL